MDLDQPPPLPPGAHLGKQAPGGKQGPPPDISNIHRRCPPAGTQLLNLGLQRLFGCASGQAGAWRQAGASNRHQQLPPQVHSALHATFAISCCPQERIWASRRLHQTSATSTAGVLTLICIVCCIMLGHGARLGKQAPGTRKQAGASTRHQQHPPQVLTCWHTAARTGYSAPYWDHIWASRRLSASRGLHQTSAISSADAHALTRSEVLYGNASDIKKYGCARQQCFPSLFLPCCSSCTCMRTSAGICHCTPPEAVILMLQLCQGAGCAVGRSCSQACRNGCTAAGKQLRAAAAAWVGGTLGRGLQEDLLHRPQLQGAAAHALHGGTCSQVCSRSLQQRRGVEACKYVRYIASRSLQSTEQATAASAGHIIYPGCRLRASCQLTACLTIILQATTWSRPAPPAQAPPAQPADSNGHAAPSAKPQEWGAFSSSVDHIRSLLPADAVAAQAEMFLVNGDLNSHLYTSSRAMHSSIISLLQVCAWCTCSSQTVHLVVCSALLYRRALQGR